MLEKERLRQQAYEEYLKDKEAVDDVINRIMEEDKKAFEYQNIKKQQALEAMAESHARKQQILAHAKQLEQQEVDNMLRY